MYEVGPPDPDYLHALKAVLVAGGGFTPAGADQFVRAQPLSDPGDRAAVRRWFEADLPHLAGVDAVSAADDGRRVTFGHGGGGPGGKGAHGHGR